MKVIYSLNKKGFEAEYWLREISAASDPQTTFIPFNHGIYLDPDLYKRAQLLDNLYYDREPGLMRMYEALQNLLATEKPEALIVDNMMPYHPDFLRKLRIYKVLRTTDGPTAAYDRDIPYVHGYDHVLFNNPAHSRDMDMKEKMLYVGAKRADFWPLALFDQMFDSSQTEETIMAHEREVDIVFVGSLYFDKMPLLARIKKAFGSRVKMYGQGSWKRNAFFNAKYGFPGWVRPLPFEQYVPLYQSAKIGVNVHIRGAYTLGSYRMFELPGNGVMQLSDGGKYLSSYYDVGNEIVGYDDAEDLIRKITYYLDRPEERQRIALNGFRAVVSRHRIARRMHEAAALIREGMSE